jgi:O-antigen/teichoic acid export membrane protein
VVIGAAHGGCDTRRVPGDATFGVEPGQKPTSGEHERQLAISTIAQQASQITAVVMTLAAITVLARRLSLPEFGTYGLLVSLTAYVLFIQGSIETAAVKSIAEAADQRDRDQAFSTAFSLYAAAGFLAAALLAIGGTALLDVLSIPIRLHHEAQLSLLALAVVTCIGWPCKIFQDVLRGTQSFVASASAEIVAFVTVGALLIGLAVNQSPLWALVAAGASPPLFIGAVSAAIVRWNRLPYRFRRDSVTSSAVRSFGRTSSYLSLVGVSGLVIYSMDRAILAAFRSAATVGLYEGPVRAHNLVQQVHGTLTIPVLPAATRYLAEGDTQRTRDLLVRGTRYTLAAVVPVAIVFMILAQPILRVWLGAKFATGATALTLLVAYWLINANTGVAGNMLVAAGRARLLAGYAAAVAAANLVLSLALTPSLGLNGVVLGTSISYVLAFPFFLATTLSTFRVSLGELTREAWVPAYTTGAVTAAALIAVRLSVHLDSVAEVTIAGLLALFGYWAAYYLLWLRPSERALVKNVALAFLGR